jgi:hypothetical protein
MQLLENRIAQLEKALDTSSTSKETTTSSEPANKSAEDPSNTVGVGVISKARRRANSILPL